MQQAKNYSDPELVSAIQSEAGIEGAIAFIYRNYYRLLESFVLSNSGREADAEDIIQEVLIVFVEMVQKNKYRGEASVKSFLYTLTRNLWISELRKRSSGTKRNEFFEHGREKTEQDVSHYLVYKESQKSVMKLFDQLGEKCKQILTLFYYDNLPMNEILKHTTYENEQVLRNKKYKCLKELTDRIQASPFIYNELKSALKYTVKYE
jgi:RNA polymerase sigma factor (sigma-70 family)